MSDDVQLLRWGEVTQALEAVRAALDDPKTLAPLAKRMRGKAKTWIESQGGGTWAPFAASTLKRYQSEGSSNITKFGKVRQGKIDWIDARAAKLEQAIGKGGVGQAERRKLERLAKRLDTLRRQAGTAQRQRDRVAAAAEKIEETKAKVQAAKTQKARQRQQERLTKLEARHRDLRRAAYNDRKIGKATAETRDGKMMPNMAKTIRTTIRREGRRELVLTLYSKSGKVGEAQDKGLGKGGKPRSVLPPVEAADLAYVKDLLEGKCMDAWEGK